MLILHMIYGKKIIMRRIPSDLKGQIKYGELYLIT